MEISGHFLMRVGVALYGDRWKQPLAFDLHRALREDLKLIERRIDTLCRAAREGRRAWVPEPWKRPLLELLEAKAEAA